jgi:hypothetical protein
MTISTEDRKVIREVFELMEKKTTHMLPEVMVNPVTKYTSAEQVQKEIDVLFRKLPNQETSSPTTRQACQSLSPARKMVS